MGRSTKRRKGAATTASDSSKSMESPLFAEGNGNELCLQDAHRPRGYRGPRATFFSSGAWCALIVYSFQGPVGRGSLLIYALELMQFFSFCIITCGHEGNVWVGQFLPLSFDFNEPVGSVCLDVSCSRFCLGLLQLGLGRRACATSFSTITVASAEHAELVVFSAPAWRVCFRKLRPFPQHLPCRRSAHVSLLHIEPHSLTFNSYRMVLWAFHASMKNGKQYMTVCVPQCITRHSP